MTGPAAHVIATACSYARMSPCLSQRGAVVFRGRDYVVAGGWNQQVAPFACARTGSCKATCRRTAVHAEQAALLASPHAERKGADLLHVKVGGGHLLAVPSGPPSCAACSKLAVLAGIAGVWLLHKDGWHRYEAVEFHELSVRHEIGV